MTAGTPGTGSTSEPRHEPGPEPGESPVVTTEPAGGGTMPARSTLVVAAAIIALAIGLGSGLLLAGTLLQPSVPTDSSVEAGFARDMQTHHAQAVEMSVLVRDRTQDPDVRLLALDILLSQQQQQGQMFGWLATWGLPQASTRAPMAWMDHGSAGHAGTDQHGDAGGATTGATAMPGLATDEQMDRLRAADGVEAERLYLALMIPHHLGGVEMAEAALEQDLEPQVQRLAEAVVAAQSAEIDVLTEMLAERGGPPPDL